MIIQSPAGQVRLPLFARMCRRALAIVGLRGEAALALASSSQRAWRRAAIEAFAEMGRRGAHLPKMVFFAHDERRWGSWMEDEVGMLFSKIERATKRQLPWGYASASCCTYMDKQGVISGHVGTSREGPQASIFMRALASEMGSADLARIAVAGHEWAHCWQHREGLPFGELLAAKVSLATKAPWTAPAMEYVQAFKERKAFACPAPAAGEALAAIEEAFCDIVGAWAASHVAGRSVAEALARIRDADFALDPMTNARYDTGAMLRACLPADGPTPESFQELLSRAMDRMPAVAVAAARAAAGSRRLATAAA